MRLFNIFSFALTLSFALPFSSAQAQSFCAGTKKLTAAQCTTLSKDLMAYETLIVKIFGNRPIIEDFIADAQVQYNKICPTPAPSNGFSTTTEYQCTVIDSTDSNYIDLGLNASGALTNVAPVAKVVCVSATACQNIASAKFSTAGSSMTTQCSDPTNMNVQHLTDAQLQTLVNAAPQSTF